MQLDELKNRYPFPKVDAVESFYFSLDGGGRNLIIEALNDNEVDLMVEIGSFLCGSAIQWLESRLTLTVIGIDPWEANFVSILERYDGLSWADSCFKNIKDRQEFINSVRKHGPYVSALANVKKYKDRFIPVKAFSPQVLYELHDIGVKPQLIYFDSNKMLDDLDISQKLFPDAILTGDDWLWGADQGLPTQTAVKKFCKKHGFSVEAKDATWIIQK
jgi:hypothetical protein